LLSHKAVQHRRWCFCGNALVIPRCSIWLDLFDGQRGSDVVPLKMELRAEGIEAHLHQRVTDEVAKFGGGRKLLHRANLYRQEMKTDVGDGS
jgi:hypothetical protein